MPYRVLIVDDQLIPRQLFENTVTGSDRYVLAAALDSAVMADAWCAGGLVDLIIMDVVMDNGPTGLEAAGRIKASYPQVKIIVVTSLPDALFLERARQLGVDSYWYKELQSAPLLEVMDRTMAGEQVWPDHPPRKKLGLADSSEFTDREICEQLHLSFNTVRYHVDNLMAKTGQSSRTGLAVAAVLSGVIFPGFE